MKKELITLPLVFFCSLLGQAQEFWLQPSKFFYNVGEKLIVNFNVGENFIGKPWKSLEEAPGIQNVYYNQVAKVELHDVDAPQDILEYVIEGAKNHIEFPLTSEGTKLIVMQSTNSLIDLEADKFNAYLKEKGLDEAYLHREKTHTLNKSGKELYARCAKLMVQVGKKTDDTFKKSAGLPVEIIPQQNPYALKVGDPVRFLILYEGKPLFGARVNVMNRYNNRTTLQNIYSQQDGTIDTHISNPGAWMVSFVKMVPSKDPKSDWQSYWGSLVFGIQ